MVPLTQNQTLPYLMTTKYQNIKDMTGVTTGNKVASKVSGRLASAPIWEVCPRLGAPKGLTQPNHPNPHG
jgi:hypothetical protein